MLKFRYNKREVVMQRIAQFYKVDFEEFSKSLKEDNALQIWQDIKLPRRATTGSAGYDFFAPFDIDLQPGESISVPTGIRVQIESGWVLMIFPRSGLGFKYRVQLDNTVGIIDSDYFYSDNEGHIFCKITNCGLQGKAVHIDKGAGFAQGVLLQYGITLDDEVSTVRNGGFGSTTKC